jgi:Ca2+-transporting ATPase
MQVDVVGSVNDWQKERQFKALNEKKEDRSVKVIRDGTEKVVNIKVYICADTPDIFSKKSLQQDILVGDIALLEPGEIVPVDGLFIRGHGVKCDESGATGESDAVRKVPYESLINADGKMHEHADHADDMGEKGDCFLLSGSKVLEGVGCYVVIAVGVKSFNGRIMLGVYFWDCIAVIIGAELWDLIFSITIGR